MRKLSIVFFVFVLGVTLGAMTASAQTGIALSTSSTSGISFTSTGSGNLSMGAAVFGSAAGLGALLGDSGFYSLMSGAPIALTLGPSLSPIFADYTASGTLNFDITTLPGGAGSTLLKGTLTLVDLVQAFSTGMTNTSAILNLTITGGSLASSYSGNTGIGQLTINLAGLGFLPSLSSGSAKLGSATLDALPTPEPRSMLLFGTGLVLFGIVLRRRLSSNTSVAVGA
jgi:PEP-CTERM motif